MTPSETYKITIAKSLELNYAEDFIELDQMQQLVDQQVSDIQIPSEAIEGSFNEAPSFVSQQL